MTTPSNDELAARLASYARVGDSLTGGTASTPLFVDSSGKVQSQSAGGFPFAVKVSGVATTSEVLMDITGTSTNTANDLMHGQLVDGAQVTTFTKTGFIRVQITDSGGNITNGQHYIQIGSLS